jgi:phosphatidylglycerophosphate synthase
MIDRAALNYLQPLTLALARRLVLRGISAESITWTGFVLGLLAALAVSVHAFFIGLVLILLNRVCDGLDGAVARATKATDRGAFLDIALDFLFYASVPLAFAIADPTRNALAASVLLAAFIGTGSSFLAYAVIAAKRGETSTVYPTKGFFYLGGLTEGGETIACFVLMCLLPGWFPVLASGFAVLCVITTVTRIAAGLRTT